MQQYLQKARNLRDQLFKTASPDVLHWSIYKWLEGSSASIERIKDLISFATGLGEFLNALQQCDATGGPLAGEHIVDFCYFR